MSIDGYRLTEADEQRVKTAISDTVANWTAGSNNVRAHLDGVARESLRRIGYHSIGCSAADLRPDEIEFVSSVVSAATS